MSLEAAIGPTEERRKAPRASLGSPEGDDIFGTFDPRVARRFLAYLRPHRKTVVFAQVAVLLFLAGSVMTWQAWSFGQAWIAISVALWVLSAVLGAVYLGPRVKRAAELFEAEGPTSQAGRDLIDRLFLVSRLELVGFAVIIALMTFKPGA